MARGTHSIQHILRRSVALRPRHSLGDGTYADFCDSLDNCLMRFNDSAANPSHTVYVRKVAPTKENNTGWQCQVILKTKEFPALFEMTFNYDAGARRGDETDRYRHDTSTGLPTELSLTQAATLHVRWANSERCKALEYEY